MKQLSEKQIDEGVQDLNELRARIVPQYVMTPLTTIQELIAASPEGTHLKQVFMWDKQGFLTFANSVVPSNPGGSGNNTNPCPPFCNGA